MASQEEIEVLRARLSDAESEVSRLRQELEGIRTSIGMPATAPPERIGDGVRRMREQIAQLGRANAANKLAMLRAKPLNLNGTKGLALDALDRASKEIESAMQAIEKS